jgi:hypothetical protein
LESDRTRFLTVLAASRGVINFSQARLTDPSWWRRCRFLFAGLEADLDFRLLDAAYRRELALVGNGNLEAKDFAKAQERAREVYFGLTGVYRPWEGKTLGERQGRERASIAEVFKQVIGDPTDPEFLRREAEGLAAWRAAEAAAKTDVVAVDVVRQRLLARGAKK